MPRLARRWLAIALVSLGAFFVVTHISTITSLLPENLGSRPGIRPGSLLPPGSKGDFVQQPLFDSIGNGPFDWADIPIRNPVTNPIPLPTGQAADIPNIQFDFSTYIETAAHKHEREERLAAVKEAFVHSWEGYKKNAWLHDEVKPVSGRPHDPFGGWGATLVDTLDTLWIVGMEKDFAIAVAALEDIDFSRGTMRDLNLFETTIRYLGGFLSAYDLSNGRYPLLLKKAVEVAEMMYRAFDTHNRMPITRWDWKKYLKGDSQDTPKSEIIAELGSLTMEFTRLSQLTGDPKYFDAVQRISDVFYNEQNRTQIPGLWPLSVNPFNGDFHYDTIFTVGGMADSVFEYLSKTYLLLQGRSPMYASMHTNAVNAMKEYLTFEALLPSSLSSAPTSTTSDDEFAPFPPSQYVITPHTPLFFGTTKMRSKRPELDPRSEHLTCFAGGMLALGARALSTTRLVSQTTEDMETARRLAQGCVWSYSATRTKIGPEIYNLEPCRKGRDAITSGREADWSGNRGDCTWDRERWTNALKRRPRGQGDKEALENFISQNHLEKGFTDIGDKKYILRPEAIESLFILWRITGDEALQDAAWAMFSAITRWTRTDIAFSAIPDVNQLPSRENGAANGNGKISMTDGMESFWTAETLKYFWLIFADTDVVSLDEFVFNTEAHPFRWRIFGERG